MMEVVDWWWQLEL